MQQNSRQVQFREDFQEVFEKVRLKYGTGPIDRERGLPRSYMPGMTRRAIRLISRKIARRKDSQNA